MAERTQITLNALHWTARRLRSRFLSLSLPRSSVPRPRFPSSFSFSVQKREWHRLDCRLGRSLNAPDASSEPHTESLTRQVRKDARVYRPWVHHSQIRYHMVYGACLRQLSACGNPRYRWCEQSGPYSHVGCSGHPALLDMWADFYV